MAELDLGKVTGEQGPQGIPGSQWYQGTAVTGEATSGTVFPDSGVLNAIVNDKYWNTDTNNVYTCVLGGDSSTAQWAYVGNIQGPQGDIGPIGPTGNPGTAATIQVGEVTSGDVASVENTGTSTAAVFDFVLPKGDPGPQGPQGEKGETGDPANITGAASSIIENNLSANRALISDGSGKVAASGVTSTELGYLDGVTSGIQNQLDALNSKFPIFIILKKINGASAITFQTSFQSNSGGGQERQSILIFGADNGNPVNGLLIVWDDGNTLWSGIGDINATMNEKGQIYAALQSIAYDEFVLISAKRIYQ